MTPDERAYELLRWQSLAPMGEFDPAFPYFDVWKAASDKALHQFENEHYYETSDELKAFQYLERLGIFNQSDFYSPSKAKENEYTSRLKEHQQRTKDRAGVARPEAGAGNEADGVSPSCGVPPEERQRARPHGGNARYGFRARSRRRRQGR